MELKNLLQNDDRAVSPVIGVILMVAITVILAAVIGTFVLGLGDDINTEVQAGTSFDVSTGNATVTWISSGNADEINVTVDDEGDLETDSDLADGYEVLNNVGDSATARVAANTETTVRITVIGVRNPGGDETTTVLQTREVTLDRTS